MQDSKMLAPVIVGSPNGAARFTPSSLVNAIGVSPIERGTRKFWLDGSVILQGTCILRTPDLDSVLPDILKHWTISEIANWWASSARNPGALFVEDATEGWSACLPDPLGGAIAFSYTTAGKNFISTDTGQLVKVASDYGVAIEKDPLFQVERLLLGNGGLTNSSYSGVKSIDPFQYLVMQSGQIQTGNYDVLERLENHSLYDLFGALRADVLLSVRAISCSGSKQVISHLTGGFDSRLVLSAILNQGLQNEVSIFCSGPEGSTDRVVADGLTRAFNLSRSNGAGLATAPTQNMSERLMGALFASSGITNTGPIGRELSVPVSAMGGGYGEVLRTFFGGRAFVNPDGRIDNDALVNSFIPKTSQSTSYMSKDAVENISEKLVSRFSMLINEYDDPHFVGDAFYSYNRNRYHIGQTSLLWSRVGSRFDPLYSVAGFVLARKITQKARASNVIGHDLLESLCPELLSFPFDYDRFNSSLLEVRQKGEIRTWPKESDMIEYHEAYVPSVTSDSPFLETLRQMDSAEPVLTADERRAKVKEANILGVNFWQVVYKNTGQELLRNSFEQTLGSQMHSIVDSDYIRTLFSKKDLNKKQLRDLYSLGGIFAWLTFG